MRYLVCVCGTVVVSYGALVLGASLYTLALRRRYVRARRLPCVSVDSLWRRSLEQNVCIVGVRCMYAWSDLALSRVYLHVCVHAS